MHICTFNQPTKGNYMFVSFKSFYYVDVFYNHVIHVKIEYMKKVDQQKCMYKIVDIVSIITVENCYLSSS